MSTEPGTEYTDDELAGLSDEERAAIADEDYEGDGESGASTDDELSGDGIPDDEDTGADDSQDEDKADDLPVVDDEPAAEPEPAPQPPVDDNQPVTLPVDVAESFKTRLADLAVKFENGDIDLMQMMDQRDAINREIYNAEIAVREEHKAIRSWNEAQDAFFAENAHYQADAKRYADLNVCVKAVANSAAASKMTLAAILTKAKEIEEAMNGAVKTTAKQEGKKPLPSSPKPTMPSLKDIPAAEMNDTNTGEFAVMDNLKGMEYERALAKMTEAQRERYLKG